MKLSDLGIAAPPSPPAPKQRGKKPFTVDEITNLEVSKDPAEAAEREALVESMQDLKIERPADLHDAKLYADAPVKGFEILPVEARPEYVAFIENIDEALESYPKDGPDNLRKAFQICRARFHSFFIAHTTAADQVPASTMVEAYDARWLSPEDQTAE